MKYKTFKIDTSIEERANFLSMTVNEYIFHLTRLNAEHTNEHSEKTLEEVERLHFRIGQLEKGMILIITSLNEIKEKANGHRN